MAKWKAARFRAQMMNAADYAHDRAEHCEEAGSASMRDECLADMDVCNYCCGRPVSPDDPASLVAELGQLEQDVSYFATTWGIPIDAEAYGRGFRRRIEYTRLMLQELGALPPTPPQG